jgi:cytochrome d oxidase subunit CydB
MTSSVDIATIWAFIIAFAVFVYVVMDGFDLGLGILFPLFPEKADRDIIMTSVAPVWDGNETWLVLGGGGLMAAFPLAYAVLMPALYSPIVAMLIGLVFRGVAFEFRWRTTQSGRNRWDLAFAGGSLVAALAQGIALGAVLQGVHVEGRHYGGGWWDWLTPFSILTGLAIVIGYSLLGATWLVMKTEGELRERAYHLSWRLMAAMLCAIAAVSIATPEHHHLGGGLAGQQPALHAVRRLDPDPAHSLLYRVGLLGIPRQGQARRRIPLMQAEQKPQPPLTQRLLWFVVLWLGGVGSVAIVAYGLRLWIAPK